VQWLGLEEGVDFSCMIDLAGLTRVYNEQYGSFTSFGAYLTDLPLCES
jgi:hypothetical protein